MQVTNPAQIVNSNLSNWLARPGLMSIPWAIQYKIATVQGLLNIADLPVTHKSKGQILDTYASQPHKSSVGSYYTLFATPDDILSEISFSFPLSTPDAVPSSKYKSFCAIYSSTSAGRRYRTDNPLRRNKRTFVEDTSFCINWEMRWILCRHRARLLVAWSTPDPARSTIKVP